MKLWLHLIMPQYILIVQIFHNLLSLFINGYDLNPLNWIKFEQSVVFTAMLKEFSLDEFWFVVEIWHPKRVLLRNLCSDPREAREALFFPQNLFKQVLNIRNTSFDFGLEFGVKVHWPLASYSHYMFLPSSTLKLALNFNKNRNIFYLNHFFHAYISILCFGFLAQFNQW